MASDQSRGVFVLWREGRQYVVRSYLARLTPELEAPDGFSAGGTMVPGAGTYDIRRHALLSDGNGGVFAALEGNNQGGTGYGISVEHIDSTGVVASGWSSYGTYLGRSNSAQYLAAMCSDGRGGVLVLAREEGSSGGHYLNGFVVRRVMGNGNLPTDWATDVLFDYSCIYYAPCLLPDDANGATVLFNGCGGTRAFIVDSLGRIMAESSAGGRLIAVNNDAELGRRIVSDGQGGRYLVYCQDNDVLAEHFDGNWNRTASSRSAPSMVTYSPTNESEPRLVSVTPGAVVVVWLVDTGGNLGNLGISAQLLSDQRLAGMSQLGPIQLRIRDVVNDQGGVVRLSWSASSLEHTRPSVVAKYRVFRSVPVSMASNAANLGAAGPALGAATVGDYAWEFLSDQPLSPSGEYSYVAATTSDSLPTSNPFTAFVVLACNADCSVSFACSPDSGYSVDNLSPPTPSPFTARYDGSSVALHWTPSRVADFKEYRVYRGPTVSFVPGPQYLVSATPDTGFVDHPPLGAGDVYKLVAVDIHGNASKYAVVTPSSPVSALAALVSAVWQDDAAQLAWYGGALALTEVTVLRDEDGAGWTDVATITGDGEGMVRFADAAVLPGHRYGYKLRFNESGVERFAGEAYISIPAGRLAIQAVAPNPVMSNRLRLRASLAQTGPARVRVLDLAGRVVRDQEAPTNLTGAFEMSLDGRAPLRPGVYIVELRQGSARATTRFTYLR